MSNRPNTTGPAPRTPYPGAPRHTVFRPTEGINPLPPLSTDFQLQPRKHTGSSASSPTTDEGYSTASTPSSAGHGPAPNVVSDFNGQTYATFTAKTISQFSSNVFAGLPSLEDVVSIDNLPHTLTVFQHGSTSPLAYKRVVAETTNNGARWFVPSQAPENAPRTNAILQFSPPTAHLNTDHSILAHAAFTYHGHCSRVVAKVALPKCGCHHRLHQEARVYQALPSDLSQYHRRTAPDETAPVPAVPRARASKREGKLGRVCRAIGKVIKKDAATTSMSEAPPAGDGSDRPRSKTHVLPPVVPKFYGYYIPEDTRVLPCHPRCGAMGNCKTTWGMPILLVEDCGVPVDLNTLSHVHKAECAKLVDGLIGADFIHGGCTPSKFVVQAGPLTARPWERSWNFPSFRLVGFGLSTGLPLTQDDDYWFNFDDQCEEDYEEACRALRFPPQVQ